MSRIVLEALFHREPILPVERLCAGLERFFGPIDVGWEEGVLVLASLGLVDLETRAAEGQSEISIQHLRRLLRVQLEGGAVKGARGSASVEPPRPVLRV